MVLCVSTTRIVESTRPMNIPGRLLTLFVFFLPNPGHDLVSGVVLPLLSASDRLLDGAYTSYRGTTVIYGR